jgi:hypothetical protein
MDVAEALSLVFIFLFFIIITVFLWLFKSKYRGIFPLFFLSF